MKIISKKKKHELNEQHKHRRGAVISTSSSGVKLAEPQLSATKLMASVAPEVKMILGPDHVEMRQKDANLQAIMSLSNI